ncbi:MAG: N-formylglutamate amidohydrolase, partial [Proteobacteria bacterium]|nr:N-formylglutamate amidohydrolase [Pseudomonadota bacterium]
MTITPEIINRDGAANLVLICDHAANFIPDEYAGLGLGEDMLATHIAWDIGAEGVARRLSGLLDCPAILARHSRLVVDTNREIDDPTLILKVSDGVRIYGNEKISEKERERRIASYHTPFHQACDSFTGPSL